MLYFVTSGIRRAAEEAAAAAADPRAPSQEAAARRIKNRQQQQQRRGGGQRQQLSSQAAGRQPSRANDVGLGQFSQRANVTERVIDIDRSALDDAEGGGRPELGLEGYGPGRDAKRTSTASTVGRGPPRAPLLLARAPPPPWQTSLTGLGSW